MGRPNHYPYPYPTRVGYPNPHGLPIPMPLPSGGGIIRERLNLEIKCQWDDHMICRRVVDFDCPHSVGEHGQLVHWWGKVRERSYDLYLIISHMLKPEIELQGEYWAQWLDQRFSWKVWFTAFIQTKEHKKWCRIDRSTNWLVPPFFYINTQKLAIGFWSEYWAHWQD